MAKSKGFLEHFLNTINDESQMKGFKKCSRWWHSEPKDLLGDTIWFVQEQGEGLEEEDEDTVKDWIEIHTEDTPDLEGIALYEAIVDSLQQGIVIDIVETSDLLIALYAHKDDFFSLKSQGMFSIITEICGVLQLYVEKGLAMVDHFEYHLRYNKWGPEETVEEIFGTKAKERYKKREELILEDYEVACSGVEEFGGYVCENRIGHRLLDLALRLKAWHYLTKDDSTKIRGEQEIALLGFMQHYCVKQKRTLLQYRRKGLNEAHSRKTIVLPKHIEPWKTGQSKRYKVDDLKSNWQDYCEALPNLPALK